MGRLGTVLILLYVLTGLSCYSGQFKGWTKDDMVVMKHYYNSFKADKEYLRVAKSIGPKGMPTNEERVYLRQQMVIAAEEARKVLEHPETLDKMHPKLRELYEDNYLKGIELTIQNMDSPDEATARYSDHLHNYYMQWYEDHWEEIKFPKEK
ncbi:MAG: hypothetical protein HY280_05220 [Nitrospinae bacterium]|nr:hypothetical protein [Nitrospinota bacterium]